jgi:hypothetical protein
MSAFEDFVQVELPKRPYTNADSPQESVLVRRGPGPRQHVGVPIADGQVLGSVGGVLQGVPQSQGGGALRSFKLVITTPVMIWDVIHNLASEEVIIQAFDEDKYVIIPEAIQILDENTVRLTFNTAQSGVARVVFLD